MSVFVFGVFGMVIGLFLVMALFLLKGRGSFLIAGFNTLSEEEKAKYDRSALCRFVGWLLIVFSFVMVLFPLGMHFEIYWLTYCGSALIFVVVIFVVVYANTGRRFHKSDNTMVSGIFESEKPKGGSKATIIVTLVFFMIVFIAIGGLLFYGVKEPEVNLLDGRVQIKSMYGLDVDFSDIANVSLLEQSMREVDVGVRVNGFGGFGETLKGHFKSDSLGETLLFVYSTSSPTIRIERNSEKDIYLSFRNGEKTVSLFDEFNAVINKNNNDLGDF